MHPSFFLVAAGAAFVLAQVTPSEPLPTGTGLPLGANCNPAVPNACANGVDCYATNVMLIPRCGNFQATCSSDAECAFNTCNRAQGLCNGLLASTTATASSTTSATQSGSTTPSGTGLPLGATCTPSIPNACANGVACYATNSMLIPRCGNFQATCSSDAQCAFNTCVKGLCNGFITSMNGTTSTTAPTSSGGSVTTAAVPTTAVVSGNSSVTVPTTAPTTTPIVTNDSTKMSWSLSCLLGAASFFAFAL